VIKERVSGGHGVTVCGRQTDTPADTSTPHGDEQPVYLSDSNSVEIRVVSARSKKDGRQFLLRYHGQCVCVCVCVCVFIHRAMDSGLCPRGLVRVVVLPPGELGMKT